MKNLSEFVFWVEGRLQPILAKLDALAALIATKANQSQVNSLVSTIGTKASQSQVDALVTTVGTKASQSQVDALVSTVSTKASQSQVDSLVSDIGELDTTLQSKADNSALTQLRGLVMYGIQSPTYAQAVIDCAAIPSGASAFVHILSDESPGNAASDSTGVNPSTYYTYFPSTGLVQQVAYPVN